MSNGRASSPVTSRRQRKLMEDCLILLVALVLTEPRTTKRQSDMIPKLIQRLRKECR